MTVKQTEANTHQLSSNSKGKHAELLAQTALLANGFVVMEPISPQPYDLAIRRADGSVRFIQVKTAYLRDEKRYGGEYLVVRGSKGNGDVYSKEEVDYFVAVWDGEAYIFPNRECSEYWCRPEQLSERWAKLEREI